MRTKYLVFASVLVGIASTCPPGHAQQPPADTCLTAPTQKAPEGSQWHYRTDRTGTRKCYFLRYDSDRVRSVTPRVERQQRSAAPPPITETVGGPQVFAQPMLPGGAEDSIIASRWPDPAKALGAFGAAPPAVADASPTVDTYGNPTGNMADQSSTETAPTESEAGSALDYRLMLASLAGALVVAGLIARLTIRLVGMPRPRSARPLVARRDLGNWFSGLRGVVSSVSTRVAAIPGRLRRPAMTHETMRSPVAAREPANEHVNLVPPQGGIDDRQGESEEIDVLLRQIERLGERPAA